MKQRRIKELTINHYEHGSSVQYTPSRTEEYAAVLAQAEAHQDLRFHATSNSVENIVILPWESVIGVYATYETVDVAAPTDAICEEGSPLEIQIAEYSTSCYDVSGQMVNFKVNGNWIEVANDGTVPEGLLTVTLNGEEVEAELSSALTIPGIGQTAHATFTATYEGNTAELVVAVELQCGS